MPRIYTEDLKELPDIPDRFGEKNWRRFEPIIKEVIKRFPEPVVFVPKNIAPITAVSRIRDAVRAFLHPTNNWESEIDPSQIFSIWPQVNIKIANKTHVAIGLERELLGFKVEDKIERIQETGFVDATNTELFFSLLCCKHFELFAQPFTVLNATEEQVHEGSMRYPNAPMVDNGDGTYTLV